MLTAVVFITIEIKPQLFIKLINMFNLKTDQSCEFKELRISEENDTERRNVCMYVCVREMRWCVCVRVCVRERERT